MFRHSFISCVLAALLGISGCEKSHPGNYAQPEVEAQLKKSLKLTELQITADPGGGYTGTGKTADGESLKLKITQDLSSKRLSWKADGDRGTIEEGKYEFE